MNKYYKHIDRTKKLNVVFLDISIRSKFSCIMHWRSLPFDFEKSFQLKNVIVSSIKEYN